MIRIIFKNGDVVDWKKGQYTDYKYDARSFVVINRIQYVGIYNFDCITSVTITENRE